ncbi:hypothetical protein GCM10018966_023950 [Streptomyces yanii]
MYGMAVPPASTPKPSVMVYVPEGVVYVLCLRVAPSTTPFDPIRPLVERTDFQPPEPLAHAVTVAYEPLAFTVMSCVASPTEAGTGKEGADVGAWAPPVPPSACAPVPPADGERLPDGFTDTEADAEADAEGDAEAEAEAEAELLGEWDAFGTFAASLRELGTTSAAAAP